MTDAFENWISSFEDDDYIDWLENKATDAQKEKALNIRETMDESELEEMEQEQTAKPKTK